VKFSFHSVQNLAARSASDGLSCPSLALRAGYESARALHILLV
jgi:hypothetical protein